MTTERAILVSAVIVSTTIAVSTWRIHRTMITTFEQLRDAINTATNKLADRFKAFADGVGHLSPAQQAEADAMVASLNAIGADASNPVPEPVDPAVVG